MKRRSTYRLVAVVAGALLLPASACSSTTATTSTPSTSTGGAGSSTTTSTNAKPVGTIATSTPGCGVGNAAGKMPGPKYTQIDQTMISSGVERSYKEYVPGPYGSTSPTPLVIDLHGYSEGNAIHTAMSNLSATAEKDGFILVTPQGNGKIPYWNAVPNPTGPDDVQFISDLIDEVGKGVCIDPARVYVDGLSNGAFMSSLLACRLSDKIAAIAPLAGLRWPDNCAPTRPVPIVAFHGTQDPLVHYDGSPSEAAAKLPTDEESKKNLMDGLTFKPLPENLKKWATFEGCQPDPAGDQVTDHVLLVRYSGCHEGSVVEMYVVDGGGHSWPGSAFSAASESILGPTTMEIDANDLMWKFFQEHPLSR